MERMDEGHRAELGALLREKRAETAGALAAFDVDLVALRSARADATSDDEHDPEGSTLSGEWSRMQGLRDETAAELAQIDAVLHRLDGGAADVGICASCGRAIPIERLRARPMALLCVACAA